MLRSTPVGPLGGGSFKGVSHALCALGFGNIVSEGHAKHVVGHTAAKHRGENSRLLSLWLFSIVFLVISLAETPGLDPPLWLAVLISRRAPWGHSPGSRGPISQTRGESVHSHFPTL